MEKKKKKRRLRSGGPVLCAYPLINSFRVKMWAMKMKTSVERLNDCKPCRPLRNCDESRADDKSGFLADDKGRRDRSLADWSTSVFVT